MTNGRRDVHRVYIIPWEILHRLGPTGDYLLPGRLTVPRLVLDFGKKIKEDERATKDWASDIAWMLGSLT